MRMRRKKNLEPRMAACREYLVENPADYKGTWAKKAQNKPIFLEIGCGKGKFIVETAMQNPDNFYIAVEVVPSVLLLAMEKAMALRPLNLLFISADAKTLGDIFDKNEVAGIFLNFSDPWPPKRHWKRRLTHENFLRVYDVFLSPSGEIAMKTDNVSLFEFSLCSFSSFGYVLTAVSLDLHQTEIENIMTEYETNFSQKGMKIMRCVAKKP